MPNSCMRQQVGVKSQKYKNMLDALIKIPLEEGRITGDGRVRLSALYRGLFATMIGSGFRVQGLGFIG